MHDNNEKDSRYADIINLPHHTSSKHPRMSRENRASQFSPFAALTGYDLRSRKLQGLQMKRLNLMKIEYMILTQNFNI